MGVVQQLRRRAAREAELALPERVLREVRRRTGAAAPRRALAGRRVAVVGAGERCEAIAGELARLGAQVERGVAVPHPARPPHAAVIVADGPVPDDGFAACAAAAEERYLGVVRLSLAVLPALRARRRGQLVVVSPTERPPSAPAAAARAAIDAHLECATPEVLRDGVALTHLRVGEDAAPGATARAVVDALATRARGSVRAG
jgi:hypothetical protein